MHRHRDGRGAEGGRVMNAGGKGPKDEWIDVEIVAAEMGLTDRQAWEWVKRLGVPCVGPARNVMRKSRFTRADWNEAIERSKGPAVAKEAEPENPAERRRRRAAAADDDLGAWRSVPPGRRG
jgi:hypothetical protein